MTRVLRYPRLSALVCAATFACACGRDVCVNAGLHGWALVLLVATGIGLLGCLALLSCRFLVDEMGVGVGFLLHVRRTDWEELAALGALCCNSRRMYLYGIYQSSPDFIRMLHCAPRCGYWGFVVPLSRKLTHAVLLYCPYPVDLAPPPRSKRPRRMRARWQQAALYTIVMMPTAALAFLTGTLMLLRAQAYVAFPPVLGLTLSAVLLFAAGLLLLYRAALAYLTCPIFNEQGVGAGVSMYLPWEEVRFGYVHRLARTSGLFLLSQPLEAVVRRGAPPVVCLSMPDTSTLLLAYLTYCPNAPKGMDG